MRSDAATVEAYLAALPDDRREALAALRAVILERLPPGYVEALSWGMIAYEVPLETHPDTYNGQPLLYAALASQKRHMALYLTGVYADEARREAFVAAWEAAGKRLDMGKSCVRFKRLEDVPLDVVGEAIAAMPVDELVAAHERVHGGRKGKAKG